MNPDEAFEIVRREFLFASAKMKPFNSAHEGAAVIEEEWDELWEAVKMRKDGVDDDGRSRGQAMTEEAKQLAAMAIRFLVDLC